MPAAAWKGYLTFGLVSVPVKLVRAARPEKIAFRQLHKVSGARVRQKLVTEAPPEPEDEPASDSRSQPIPITSLRGEAAKKSKPAAEPAVEVEPIGSQPLTTREVTRDDLVKGFEYEKDRYATITKEELANIQPKTSREMQILEFVKLDEVDPIYFETSYYVSPDTGGERAYAILFNALRKSGLVAVAQIAMHNREHIALIRAGRRGIILHTMFYESEIRHLDEYRTDAQVDPKELDLALLLVKHLEAPFAPDKYRDTYRERLQALIQAKISSSQTVEAPAPQLTPVVDIMDALRKSLDATAKRKPPATQEEPDQSPKSTRRRNRTKGA